MINDIILALLKKHGELLNLLKSKANIILIQSATVLHLNKIDVVDMINLKFC